MKTPRSCIHIEELVLAVPGVLLEFDFHETVVINCLQETEREFFNDRQIDALHVRRRSPELSRMLAGSPSDKATMRLPIAEEGAVGNLAASIPGDDLLHQNFLGRYIPRC